MKVSSINSNSNSKKTFGMDIEGDEQALRAFRSYMSIINSPQWTVIGGIKDVYGADSLVKVSLLKPDSTDLKLAAKNGIVAYLQDPKNKAQLLPKLREIQTRINATIL